MKNVFCIGPNKTGTTSLKQACNLLGIQNAHSSEPFSFLRSILHNINSGKKILHRFKVPGFFADIWCPRPSTGVISYYTSFQFKKYVIKKVAEEYPDTIFINNRRLLNTWLDSRERHVKAPKPDWYWNQPMRWEEVDRKSWFDEWWEMENGYLPLFREMGIPYHEIDVCDGDGWEELCRILDCPVPDLPFPRENEGAGK